MAAAISLTSCSSNDNEQEKSFTTAPVEQTKFFVCEASGETRGAIAIIDTLFTEDDIEWFNVATREVRFKNQDIKKNAVQWETFTKYLESKGKLRK